MARRKKNFTVKASRKRLMLFAVVATIAAIAWILSIPTVAAKVAPAAGVTSETLSYYADVIFTFAVSLLLFLFAIAFFSIPFVNYVLIIVAVAVLYHALRKINVI